MKKIKMLTNKVASMSGKIASLSVKGKIIVAVTTLCVAGSAIGGTVYYQNQKSKALAAQKAVEQKADKPPVPESTTQVTNVSEAKPADSKPAEEKKDDATSQATQSNSTSSSNSSTKSSSGGSSTSSSSGKSSSGGSSGGSTSRPSGGGSTSGGSSGGGSSKPSYSAGVDSALTSALNSKCGRNSYGLTSMNNFYSELAYSLATGGVSASSASSQIASKSSFVDHSVQYVYVSCKTRVLHTSSTTAGRIAAELVDGGYFNNGGYKHLVAYRNSDGSMSVGVVCVVLSYITPGQ